MGIKNDAGKLLLYIYYKKTRGEKIPQVEDLKNSTKWDDVRLYNAVEYCENKQFIVTNNYYGMMSKTRLVRDIKTSDVKNDFERIIFNITELGIDIVEGVEREDGEKQFNIMFNFNFNMDSLINGKMSFFG